MARKQRFQTKSTGVCLMCLLLKRLYSLHLQNESQPSGCCCCGVLCENAGCSNIPHTLHPPPRRCLLASKWAHLSASVYKPCLCQCTHYGNVLNCCLLLYKGRVFKVQINRSTTSLCWLVETSPQLLHPSVLRPARIKGKKISTKN